MFFFKNKNIKIKKNQPKYIYEVYVYLIGSVFRLVGLTTLLTFCSLFTKTKKKGNQSNPNLVRHSNLKSNLDRTGNLESKIHDLKGPVQFLHTPTYGVFDN